MRSCLALPALLLAVVIAGTAPARGQAPQPQPGPRALAADPLASVPETIELAAGGPVLVPDERLAVEAEEIVLARAAVRTTLVVRNTSAEPLTRYVSWPLPDIDMSAVGEGVVVLPAADPGNFASAVVTVDGAAVPLAIEQRAAAFGRDITALLETAAVPLNPLAPGVEEALRGLAPDRLAELEERGIVTRDDERIVPAWTLRTTAFWRQTFEPAKALTIGLAYAPVTASGLWSPESLGALKEAYCIDRGFEEAIAARLAKSGHGLVVHRLTYAVAGHPGWWTSVQRHRLAIEKSGFETLIATCVGDLRTVGPTLLETVRRDFKPGDDIRVLWVN